MFTFRVEERPNDSRFGCSWLTHRAIPMAGIATLVASTFTASLHQPAWAADVQVSVFNQAGLNGSGCGGENENLIAIINEVDGYTVDDSITDFIDRDGETPLATQLADSTFFFMTDMENADGDSDAFLPVSAAQDFEAWTDGGGVMVMTGTGGSDDVDFLNKIYGWDLESVTNGAASEVTANTDGTPFSNATGGVDLTEDNATDAIDRGTVANFTSMWEDSNGKSQVAVIQYGSGYVIYMGWDFYGSGPGCDNVDVPWVQGIIPAALNYATALSSAGLDTVSTTGATLDYELSEGGDYSYVVVAEGSTDPTPAQIVAGSDYGDVTVVDSGTGSLTGSGSDWTAAIAMTGLTESTAYEIFVVTEPTDADPAYSAIEDVAFKTLPGVPSVSSVVAGDSKVTVAISASNNAEDFEYSTDGGTTWTNQGSISSPWVISGLTNGTEYSFQFRSIYGSDGDPAGAGASTSTSSATPKGAPANSASPSITGTVSSGQTLTAADGTWSEEGASITATTYQWVSTSGGMDTNIAGATAQTLCVPVSLVGTTLKVTVTKTNSGGSTSATSSATSAVVSGTACTVPGRDSSDDDEDEAAPPVVSPTVGGGTPGVVPPRAATPPQANLPVTRQGPVLRNGVVPSQVRTPEVRIGGVATSVQSSVTNPSTLSVRAGTLSLGVQVQQGQGGVSQAQDGSTEIAVQKGGRTALTGSGLRPDSTVQVFLPLQGSNAKELTRIPVGPDGSFNGDAAFATAPDQDPLPIGRQVLQLVSVDENGEEVVVEMTVNIAQPAPAPEFNRVEGVVPTLTPGTSIATNGGVPEQVTVSAVEDRKLAVVEGEGWSMAVAVNSEGGAVEGTEGGASIKLVRDESARVSGDGFMPGTRADVWLFSDPTLLGTVTIDDDGRFDGEVNIDGRVIPPGNHTLQMQGVGEDGYVRAANMGVTVDDEPAGAATETAASSLMFVWWILGVFIVFAVGVGVTIARRRH